MRARPILFNFTSGSRTISSPTIGQVIECVHLDPLGGLDETPVQNLHRVLKQARLIVGDPNDWLLDLTYPEITSMLSEIYRMLSGSEAQASYSYNRDLVVSSLEELTIDLAAFTHKTPREIDRIELIDALALRKKIHDNIETDARFQAQLAGCKI